ncbi:MAG: putative toxin-antitoxin system toxin component, PIN family [Candidatus Competibacteraceae bacterium]|nr:putative toxin-antitoxin system toxin component, PIN family [Candidatus Competibacteraceae bacterium]
MRLVLDTNVVLSVLLWRGKPYQLLDALSRRPDVYLFSSPALLEELADVLARPLAVERLALIGTTVNEVLALYRTVVEVVEPALAPRVVRDADDDRVIAAALAAHAAFIVSGDDDLPFIGSYQGIRILTAAEALRRIEAGNG